MRELDTWEINIKTKLTFHNVKITYPEGLNSMIKMFRLEIKVTDIIVPKNHVRFCAIKDVCHSKALH